MRRRIPVLVLVSVGPQLGCLDAYTLGRERGERVKEEAHHGIGCAEILAEKVVPSKSKQMIQALVRYQSWPTKSSLAVTV